jgi:hypothetical protein
MADYPLQRDAGAELILLGSGGSVFMTPGATILPREPPLFDEKGIGD